MFCALSDYSSDRHWDYVCVFVSVCVWTVDNASAWVKRVRYFCSPFSYVRTCSYLGPKTLGCTAAHIKAEWKHGTLYWLNNLLIGYKDAPGTIGEWDLLIVYLQIIYKDGPESLNLIVSVDVFKGFEGWFCQSRMTVISLITEKHVNCMSLVSIIWNNWNNQPRWWH